MAIPINVHEQPASSAASYFRRTNSKASISSSRHETDLLKSIRIALRGYDTKLTPSCNTAYFILDDQPDVEQEITWNENTVLLSIGGVMRKKWNFQAEGQPIQWACFGWIEQNSVQHKSSGRKTDPFLSKKAPERPTFGPFAHIPRHDSPADPEETTRVSAIFVFFRSIARVFAINGIEYTFSLPFLVRRAWPISPHGVLIQRLLEPGELEEAELTGDSVLPTIFSMTSPFAEATAVGLTCGLVGGFDEPVKLLREESSKTLKSIGPNETVIWVSHDCPASDHEIFVTVDAERRQLSVWRYAYIKPTDTPAPLQPVRVHDEPRRHSLPLGRRVSTSFSPSSPPNHQSSQPPEFPDLPPLSSLPGMPPSLATAATMTSLVSEKASSSSSQWSLPAVAKPRRNSLTRNDLSLTMDRMVLGGKMDTEASIGSIDQGKMRPAVWIESLYVQDITEEDALSARNISVALFDSRWDGNTDRCLMSICLPCAQSLVVLSLSVGDDDRTHVTHLKQIKAISVTAVRATRHNVWDLLVLQANQKALLLTHGVQELPLQLKIAKLSDDAKRMSMDVDIDLEADTQALVSMTGGYYSRVTFKAASGHVYHSTIDLLPQDSLTLQVLQMLALSLPPEISFELHSRFLAAWAKKGRRTSGGIEFDCLFSALVTMFSLDEDNLMDASGESAWVEMAKSESHRRFCEDPVFRFLKKQDPPRSSVSLSQKRHTLLGPLLYALHTLGEELRMSITGYRALIRLVPLICKITRIIRPEWADYWRRLCPGSPLDWPSTKSPHIYHLDDRIPVWPPDVSAILYGRISNPEWKVPFHDALHMAMSFNIPISFAYGRVDPLDSMDKLNAVYKCLADNKVSTCQKRAENAIYLMVTSGIETAFLDKLPLGIAAPLREAARTCQLAPPSDWPLPAYRTIGRDDVATSAYHAPDVHFKDGYRPIKEFIDSSKPRRTISEIGSEAKSFSIGDIDAITGVELELDDFTDIRFGQDRRLEEVARMLCSSTIPSIKVSDRTDLSEHDQAKEQQHQVLRIAERTLALPYGRAMFTYGSIPTITRESYRIPKLEYAIRLQPLNITVSPEPGKISTESINWGEFHNGVAAGLRISPFSGAVESSWIAFNKPSELTPEHAGFLFGLGLTGHLKEMMTWHTFGYLTPKHDLTSIGVLLGLSAANIGNADRHVTKLLAVHTPALLPTPEVDLNVSLMTQAAGLSGVGLLYLGTRNRRMAEVCLSQISRRDLVQPDLSNEYREAYTFSAALAFGMIMLGKGSDIPADAHILTRLTTLVHGDTDTLLRGVRPSFDINLTSPASTIALGLMYLRTERQDIADMLAVPDTVIALNRVQPAFLLMRTLARALIMWNSIAPTAEWLATQIPETIRTAIEARFKSGSMIDDALELAYYNIVAGCCFAIGLKFAGTARQEAYKMIIRYYDLFTRLVYSNGPTFDHRIKRSAVRDGLNLISISLSMVMAGTGELTCLRRLRYAYGMYTQTMYHPGFKYGIHVATHMSLGLLFLGGGRFTLGTSDAAIACMVTAFFPRFHNASSENKSFLQALRHLWVLAVEPRCLIARDVDTKEVVYLPLKILMKEENMTQLVSPTLIPDLDKIMSIRVDTPRYWPFHLDIEHIPHHRNTLLRSQTLYVKRRSAFLSYTEDPRGTRSLFVRSRCSAGEAGTLDFPHVNTTKTHPAGDLSEFITSFSNDFLFLAFADHFSRNDGETDEERLFQAYCHAGLFDSILQDKPQSIQSYLTLFRYRTMPTDSQYFHLRMQDLRFMSDFYGKVYDRRFSGASENNQRVPLMRDTTVSGALHALDQRLDIVRSQPAFLFTLGKYANGDSLETLDEDLERYLSWYLIRNGVPVSTILIILRELARDAHAQCFGVPPPGGTDNSNLLDQGIKEVLHSTGTKMTTALGSGWSVRSLEEIIRVWNVQSM